MPKNCLIDSGPLAALLDPREEYHVWVRDTLSRLSLPWLTCEAALSEAYFLLHPARAVALDRLLRAGKLLLAFDLSDELSAVLDLRAKYAEVPMSLADACLVRMTEILPDPILVTADSDFKIYRRLGRQVVPCRLP